MKTIIHTLFAAVLMVLLAIPVAQAEIVVIANSANSEAALSAKQVKKIFLGKKNAFPGGSEAQPVDQKEGSATRDAFYQKVAGKNADTMKGYWTQMIFSGKASPPELVDDDAAVKAWVAGNKNGIGYVDKSVVDGSVKVLLTLP